MKKLITLVLKHKKIIIAVCCVCIIGISIYSDILLKADREKDDDYTAQSSYIYNSADELLMESVVELSPESAKILGEAKLVNGGIYGDYTEDDTYFTSAQLNRQRSRDEALQTLQLVIDSSESMPDVKDKALNEMIAIASNTETEAVVEETVKAKGFEDCITFINDGNANVVVKSPGLLTNEVALITEIVVEETGISPENIKIVEKT